MWFFVLCIIFAIIIPIPIISISLSTYGSIDESFSCQYESSAPSSIETLNLNADVGNIEVIYTPPPVDYLVKVDVNIELSGSILAGRSYDERYPLPKLF